MAAYAPLTPATRDSSKELVSPAKGRGVASPVKASGQLAAFVQQFVDLATRRLATMLADRAAHGRWEPEQPTSSGRTAQANRLRELGRIK